MVAERVTVRVEDACPPCAAVVRTASRVFVCVSVFCAEGAAGDPAVLALTD